MNFELAENHINTLVNYVIKKCGNSKGLMCEEKTHRSDRLPNKYKQVQ